MSLSTSKCFTTAIGYTVTWIAEGVLPDNARTGISGGLKKDLNQHTL